MKLSCSTASFWSAITAPDPNNNAPATTIVFFIGELSVSLAHRQSRGPALCGPRRLASYNPAIVVYSRHTAMSEAVAALVLADRDPDPLGSCRHIDMVDLVLAPQPFDDSVDDRGARADRAGLARALDPERIGLARHVVGLEMERGAVGSARQRVIHVSPGDELAVGRAIDHLFHQRLADALHHAAMHLACEQQRIERDAEIVDDDVVDHPDDTGCRIDLDFGNVRAVRIGAVGAVERRSAVQLGGVAAGAF